MRAAATMFALVLAATTAIAEEAPQPTAPAGSATVADQIAEFLRTSPAARVDLDADGAAPAEAPDRGPHGEVSVAVGTGGYRGVYMRSDVPLGRSGRLSVAISKERDGRGYGVDRQRCDLEAMTPPRPLDVTLGGPNGRCLRPPGW